MKTDVLVPLLDADAVAEAAAEMFIASANAAVDTRGRFVVSLSGGSTPKKLYSLLASPEYADRVPWKETLLTFGDERCVPPYHPSSNYRMIREALLDHVPVPEDNVLRVEGELPSAARAALFYEQRLRELFPDAEWPAFDLALLGVGTDGHTASLFPGTRALEEETRWVAENYVAQFESWRITLTLPALNASKLVLFLVTGRAKAQIVAEAFGGKRHEGVHPSELVRGARGEPEVFLDHEAASLL